MKDKKVAGAWRGPAHRSRGHRRDCRAIRSGGRLIYVGADSGRLAALDASEFRPPLIPIPRLCIVIAGGDKAMAMGGSSMKTPASGTARFGQNATREKDVVVRHRGQRSAPTYTVAAVNMHAEGLQQPWSAPRVRPGPRLASLSLRAYSTAATVYGATVAAMADYHIFFPWLRWPNRAVPLCVSLLELRAWPRTLSPPASHMTVLGSVFKVADTRSVECCQSPLVTAPT